MGKRILGVLPALALCLALAPAAAFADAPPDFADGTWTELTSTTAEIYGGTAGAKYYLAGNVTVGGTLQIKGGTAESPVVLDLNGHVLTTASGGVIEVANSAHFTLRDSDPGAKSGYRYSVGEGGEPALHAPGDSGVPVDAVEIVGGAVAGGNASAGGGVFVGAYGEFTMEGGTIAACKSSAEGGGVYVVTRGKFTMKGGAIAACKSSAEGGGVLVMPGAAFAMEGASSISGCVDTGSGGAVCTLNGMDARGGSVSGGVRNICLDSDVSAIGNASGGGGTVFRGEVKNEMGGVISGGTFEGKVTNKWRITGGTFLGEVENEAGGEISGGTFEGKVTNKWRITGGTFLGEVENVSGEISGGTFLGEVENEAGGEITGGVFRGAIVDAGGKVDAPHSVTFDPGFDGADPAAYGPVTVAGGKTVLPEPAAPEREGWSFEGWFAGASPEPYDFDEPVTSDLALRAEWSHLVHAGGAATCTERAVCEACGEEYGDEPAGHGDAEHVAAKAATERSEGNVEHWRCPDCGRCYADEALTRELPPSDVVLARLEPEPAEKADGEKGPAEPAAVLAATGDAAPVAAAAALALAGGAVALVARRRCA